jgi:hypothetical protein
MYVMLTDIYIYTRIYILLCIYSKHENSAHICYQINTKLKHKELLKLRTQRKGEYSVIKSEYCTLKIVTY